MEKQSISQNIVERLKKSDNSELTSLQIAQELQVEHQEVVGAVKSLETANTIKTQPLEKKYIQLTKDGKDALENGAPEFQIARYLQANPKKTPKELEDTLKHAGKIGYSAAMKLKWLSLNKEDKTVSLADNFTIPTQDAQQEQVKKFQSESDPTKYDEKLLKEYTKSKLITIETLKYSKISKGEDFEYADIKPETDLTKELLDKDAYEKVKFKKYNYQAQGLQVENGALHPLLRVRTQFREILLELGFQEMPTNNFVESSFWNFDSLFQPQQHPARDAHDTFFLSHPKYSKIKDREPEYFKRVKEVHEIGGYGSLGWQYNWSEEESSKNILRTHTTSVSSRMLFKMAEDYKKTGKFTPKKFFSIDRVFRNESLDATHLAEFHQIEGLIADYNLGLGHLIGTIEDFFHRFGIKQLKFKPAYNPYTEPSMEIFGYHEGFKKWVEIGNSGIFRPEMLRPMGLPENVNVIAWGLSLERPTMIYYGLKNIRDLFGHEVNFNDTKKSSIYCINLE